MPAAVERNMRFLRNIYQRGPFERHAYTCSPAAIPSWQWPGGEYPLADKPVAHWLPWVTENYARHVKILEAVGDDSVPLAPLTTGTYLYASAFGCPAHYPPESLPAALPIVNCGAEADRLPEPDLWKSPTLYRVFELARLVQQELGRDVPLHTCDVQAGFDIACLVWNKTTGYLALADPDECGAFKRLADKCARLLKRFLVEFHREFPQLSACHCPVTWAPPEMGPWLSHDECGALSTRMFEEFCLPELIDLSETFGGIGMHCCADAEHQFESFKKIPNFYGFNRVAGKQGLAPTLKHFGGERGPVLSLGWMQPEDIADALRSAPPGTRFVFTFNGTIDQCKAWHEKVRANCG